MTLNKFINRFQLLSLSGNQGFPHPAKKSAVLIPICVIDNTLHLLFCKRPSYLKHHPAEICFPGGKLEQTDDSLQSTALRECHEELGLGKQQITLLGELESYWTLTGFEIKPFVGLIDDLSTIKIDKNEVESVFYVPFSELALSQNWHPLSFIRANKKRQLSAFKTPYGLLWGATAQITLNLVKQVS